VGKGHKPQFGGRWRLAIVLRGHYGNLGQGSRGRGRDRRHFRERRGVLERGSLPRGGTRTLAGASGCQDPTKSESIASPGRAEDGARDSVGTPPRIGFLGGWAWPEGRRRFRKAERPAVADCCGGDVRGKLTPPGRPERGLLRWVEERIGPGCAGAALRSFRKDRAGRGRCFHARGPGADQLAGAPLPGAGRTARAEGDADGYGPLRKSGRLPS